MTLGFMVEAPWLWSLKGQSPMESSPSPTFNQMFLGPLSTFLINTTKMGLTFGVTSLTNIIAAEVNKMSKYNLLWTCLVAETPYNGQQNQT